MEHIIDHIQITVKDLSMAEAFYDQLMPILGFDLKNKSKGSVPAHELCMGKSNELFIQRDNFRWLEGGNRIQFEINKPGQKAYQYEITKNG